MAHRLTFSVLPQNRKLRPLGNIDVCVCSGRTEVACFGLLSFSTVSAQTTAEATADAKAVVLTGYCQAVIQKYFGSRHWLYWQADRAGFSLSVVVDYC